MTSCTLQTVLLPLVLTSHLHSEPLTEQQRWPRREWGPQTQTRSIRREHASAELLKKAHSQVQESGPPSAVKGGAGKDKSVTAAPSEQVNSAADAARYMELVSVVYAGDHRPEEDMELYKKTDDKADEVGFFVEKVKTDSEADLLGVREGYELVAVIKNGVEDRTLFKEGSVAQFWENTKLPVEFIFGRLPDTPASLYIAFFVIVCMAGTVVWCIVSNLKHYHEHVALGADEGGEGQIGWYDPAKITHASTLLRLFAKGSLFVSRRVWNQVAGYICMWLLLTLFFCWVMKEASRLDESALVTISNYLNAFMPFFFAMYLSAVFDRWWGIRTSGLGAMWDAVDDLGMIISTSLIGDKEKFETHRKAQLRYGMLAQALIFQTARKEEDLPALVKAGLLTESEKEALEKNPGDKTQNCWVWILDLWADLLKQQAVSETVHQSVLQYCVEGRRAVSTTFTYISCQVPYGWVHLITVMVNITVIVLVMKCSIVSAKTFSKMAHSPTPCTVRQEGIQCNSSFKSEIELVCQFLELIMVPLIFIGFLEFTNEMCNPFGTGDQDFPRLQYMTGMRTENEGFFMVTGKGSLEGMPKAKAKAKPVPKHAEKKAAAKKEESEASEIPVG